MVAAESNGDQDRRAPIHLWIVGGLSLLWNLIGAFFYLAAQFKVESYMSQFAPEQVEYLDGIPAWAVAGWAIAVWLALAGSVGLLLRKRWAVWAFAVSVVGMAVSAVHSFLLSDGIEIMGSGGLVSSVIVWIIAIFLLLYSRSPANKGVLS